MFSSMVVNDKAKRVQNIASLGTLVRQIGGGQSRQHPFLLGKHMDRD